MQTLADQAPNFEGKGFCVAMAIILACALALYIGGKDND